jgi:hypothetical protein
MLKNCAQIVSKFRLGNGFTTARRKDLIPDRIQGDNGSEYISMIECELVLADGGRPGEERKEAKGLRRVSAARFAWKLDTTAIR